MNTPLPKQDLLLEEVYFNRLRKKECSILDESNTIYLDYTGGNLYPTSLLIEHFKLLNNNVFGNPHSINKTSLFATTLVEVTRQKILDYFNASDYYCIFTSNATGALKIVGECYPFQDNAFFLLTADNHNSVNGIREYAKAKGGNFEYTPLYFDSLKIDNEKLDAQLSKTGFKNKLFAFPAQSNVSGVKHPLTLIEKAKSEGWDVLLDAAAYVPTNRLDLSLHKPNFVTISFYKMFGFPTGIGCLLVHKDSFDKLQKPWFAGGTVRLASVNTPNYFLAENHERYENGTLNYLEIPAVKKGLEFIERIGIDRINKRVNSLANYLWNELLELKHSSGQHLIKVFGPKNRENMGANFIFSVFDPSGKRIPFEDIEKQAADLGICLRSGCFCNPGIDETNNCITNDDLARYYTHHQSANYQEMVNYLGKMRGATRVSMGWASNKQDLDAFISFLKTLLH